MKFKKLHFLSVLLIASLGILYLPAKAQLICTNHNFSNGNSSVTFNVENTNSTDILITDISTAMNAGFGGTFTFSLLYNTTPVNSSGATWTQGTVGAGQNGWVAAGTGTVTLPTHTTPQQVLTGLSVLIPANTTYGFALSCNGTLGYQSLTTGTVNTFSGGGVNLKTGDNISWGGPAHPATPGNYPRGWMGCIGWASALPCSGPPNVTIASGPASVCPNVPFSVTATGATTGGGITYQWQVYNTTTSSWDPVVGATSPVASITPGQSVTTDYRFVTTCANGGLTSTSNVITVGMNTFVNCYCASGAINAFDGEITNVTVGSINNSSTCASSNQLYTDYTATVTAAQLMQTGSYPISVTAGSCGGSYAAYVKIFIDFDHDGTFTGTGEEVYAGVPPGGLYTPAGVAATGVIAIPSTALTGLTRMRVILNQTTNGAAVTPCGTYNYGETEDYLVDILTAQNCSGTPATAVASAPATVCPGASFTLTATGATIGSGISYQWELYNTTTSTWDPIPTATNTFYSVTNGQTVATDYRFVTNCSFGGGFSVSNMVSVGMNSFLNCYCTSGAIYAFDGEITNVTVGSINNSSTCASSNQLYTDYTGTVPAAQMMQTGSYPISVTAGSCGGSYAAYVKIFIDLDHDGMFTGTGEEVYAGVPPGGLYTPAGVAATGVIAIPSTALTGVTRMRVILNQTTTASAVTPCGTYNYGETEDYLVDILTAQNCSGTPATAVASAPATVCPGVSFTLTATGATIGSGISYQWELYNTTTSTWDPIPTATNTFYSVTSGQTVATDYRFVTNCSFGGGFSVSNMISVGMNSFLNCYCTSGAQYAADGEIFNVTFGSINQTSTCASSNQLYTDYTSTVPAAVVMQGATVPFSMSAASCGGSYGGGAKVYIDLDHDGLFTGTGEELFFQGGFTYTPAGLLVSGNITIPITATTGVTRMRVIMIEGGTATSIVPCGIYGYGETEDYLIDIAPTTNCSGNPAVPVASAPASVCPGVNFTLTATGYTLGTGIVYQWEYLNTTTSTWDPIVPATSPTYVVTGGQTTATDYRLVTTCTFGAFTSISNTVSVGVNTFVNCYCNSAFTNVTYEFITNVTYAGINNSSGATIGGPVNYTAQTGNVSPGVASNISVTIDPDALDYVYVFIDWDQNGVLNNSGEVYTVASNTSLAGPHILSITPPLTAVLGNTRMRVMVDYNNATPNPCRNATYGEAEDYTLNVGAPPACSPPTGLAAGNVTPSSADVSWGAVGGAMGYEFAVDQTNTAAPGGASIVTPTTSTTPPTVTGLSGSSTYYLHVRTDCGVPNGFSPWALFAFSTTPVNDPCSGAISLNNTLTTPTTAIPGITTGATQSQPACDATVTANDVWYVFHTSAAGSVTINVNTTVGDIVMEVFSGTCGAFTGLIPTASSNSTTNSCIDQVATGLDWGTYSLAANTTYYVRVYGYNGANSNFTINAVGTPLAIKLADVSATNVGNRNRVDWTTESEVIGDKFELERSADGRNFTILSTINAKGRAGKYSYWDETPIAGVNHYRLKMIDASGSYMYSAVVTAKVKGSGTFTVEAYPNPVSDVLTVTVYGTTGNNPTLSISDVTGKVVKVVSVVNNGAIIDMGGLAQGMYLVKYSDNNHTQTIKVNKK